jgi:hypothetical protein
MTGAWALVLLILVIGAAAIWVMTLGHPAGP